MTGLTELTLPVAQIVPCTEAEGPGRRFALWVQGCPLRCPGCCNPEFLPFEGGETMTVEQLMLQIEHATSEHGIEGITLLGGEPFSHAQGSAVLAKSVRQRGLTVMVFSGFTLRELRRQDDLNVAMLLSETDILVDGPYDRTQPDTTRRWIGSRNQQVHFLTDRCDLDDPRWHQPDTLEVRLVDGELTINGFPATKAKELWKPRRRLFP